MTLILSNDDAERLLPMRDCVTALEEAYRELALGRAVSAQRSDAVSPTARSDAVYSLKLMGGVLPSAGVGAVRLNSDIICCFLNLSGIGLQFAAVGAALYRKARAAGAGRDLPGEWFTEDVLP